MIDLERHDLLPLTSDGWPATDAEAGLEACRGAGSADERIAWFHDIVATMCFSSRKLIFVGVAVGTALSSKGSGRPPHRSQRALLTHWAPTLGQTRSRR